MKDALGHGSDGHGVHGAELLRRLPRGMSVQRNDLKSARTAAGQIDTRVKQIWQKVAAPKRRAVAERIAQYQRVDNPNSIVRVR